MARSPTTNAATRARIKPGQPPGTVGAGLRITEQGEVIASKYGLPEIAQRTLEVTVSAVLEATVRPARLARGDAEVFPDAMATLAEAAARDYRHWVRDDPRTVRYFLRATPVEELGALHIGSRPARRRATAPTEARSIADLRAIPWVFGWTQSRHLLPGWFPFGSATAMLVRVIHKELNHGDLARQCRNQNQNKIEPRRHGDTEKSRRKCNLKSAKVKMQNRLVLVFFNSRFSISSLFRASVV